MENKKQRSQWEVAEITLKYKVKVKPSLLPQITSSKDAVRVLRQSWNRDTINLFEQMKVVLTNPANKVLGIVEISSGGISKTVGDPKLIFVAAIKAGASGFIVCHYAK